MDRREKEALDRHITGNYGENQFRNCCECGGDEETCTCDSALDETNYTDFADPGGNSALRAAHAGNPRNLPCPTCGTENVLTPADVQLGYQCNSCADAIERGF